MALPLRGWGAFYQEWEPLRVPGSPIPCPTVRPLFLSIFPRRHLLAQCGVTAGQQQPYIYSSVALSKAHFPSFRAWCKEKIARSLLLYSVIQAKNGFFKNVSRRDTWLPKAHWYISLGSGHPAGHGSCRERTHRHSRHSACLLGLHHMACEILGA